MGVVVVAALAATPVFTLPSAVITATPRRTNSVASTGKPIDVTVRPTIFDRDVLALGVARFFQALAISP